ncbi:MAG: cobalt transport protein CbiN [Candidatus Micrarchaeota archaeon]|nr:cobalt transport protein CbiN [Candidatus Micrarchaeota archaeon]
MKDTYKYALAILAVVAICASAFIISPNAKFNGSDNAGTAAILQIQPNYTRWAIPWWTPPPETESMLFALQAAIGGAIIGYYVGTIRAENKEGTGSRRAHGSEEGGRTGGSHEQAQARKDG